MAGIYIEIIQVSKAIQEFEASEIITVQWIRSYELFKSFSLTNLDSYKITVLFFQNYKLIKKKKMHQSLYIYLAHLEKTLCS